MVSRYKKSGFVSIVALLVNICWCSLYSAVAGATLTLPGIAGIALTIGMAVDCNIIIYERIIEERALGKPERSAVGTVLIRPFLPLLMRTSQHLLRVWFCIPTEPGPSKGLPSL